MKNRVYFLGLLFVSFSFFAVKEADAQKLKLSIDDAVLSYYKGLQPKSFDYVWLPDGKQFSYFDSEKNALWVRSVSASEGEEVLNLVEMNRSLAEKGVEQCRYLQGYVWLSAVVFRFEHAGSIIDYDVKKKAVVALIKLPEGAENIVYKTNEAGEVVAFFTVANNLSFIKQGKQEELSGDTDSDIVYGKTVHRNEFGISNGIFISPNAKRVAFYRNSQSEVTDYPLVDVNTRVATLKNIKYPMAGERNERVTLWVRDIEKNKMVRILTDRLKDQYLTNVSWSPDEEFVYIAVLNREQNKMELQAFSAITGEYSKTLFEETSDKWVEPEHPALFLSKTPGRFLWQSERDGYNHVYLYDANGKLIKQLTEGAWVVTQVFGLDASERYLFVEGTANNALERQVYKVNLRNGKREALTQEKGTHAVVFNADKTLFIDSYSALRVANRVSLKSTNGKVLCSLLDAENPLEDYDMPAVELFTIMAADDSTVLNGRIVKPLGFDASKKYPMVVYVYGGPHAQLVTDSWLGGVRYWQLYMAQRGYVCMTIDNRGSADRGFAFESVIHRQLGQAEMQDQVRAVEYMVSKGYVDADRVGVHGWSFGGFMTTSLLVNYPSLFKVGVAGGAVIDWKYYEIMYGERYMDMPQENAQGYEKTSLLLQADKLEGRLLMIHGAQDPVVVWQHSLQFVNACIAANKQLDYFVYPNHEHNVRGRDRVHLMDKVSMYFDDFLK